MDKTRLISIVILALCFSVGLTCFISLPKTKMFKCRVLSYHHEKTDYGDEYTLKLITEGKKFDLTVNYATYFDAKNGKTEMYFRLNPTLVCNYWDFEVAIIVICVFLGVIVLIILGHTYFEYQD